jgi:5-methylthioribose kinase
VNRDRSQRSDFLRAHPDGFFVDPTDRDGLERYARSRGWIGADEALVSVTKPGEGNMNLTLRLVTERRSFILKQSRPWVEKYPHIDAPAGRARVEGVFYRTVASSPALRSAMPELLDEDETSSVLVLEDLGRAQDFTSLYAGAELSERDVEALVSYLVELHRSVDPSRALAHRELLRNPEMRALNHEHIFRLPLAEDNGLALDDITPGLAEAAKTLRSDASYLLRARELGALYLEDGPALVHGDYFPGSWLRTAEGVKVIDPEFCFLGTPAFDLGVFVAHLHLARQPSSLGESVLERYRERSGAGDPLLAVARQLAGIEIMRRLIGVAQIPRLRATLEEKKNWLALSRELVCSSPS